ncbi:MAG TPA: vWA domain-containing protein [Gemmataceae bacterium]|nr:vWA domain-containing protein [Gemmataceae bacterium]
MSQLKNVVDPFGEVNVYPAGAGRVRVVATILMEPHKEGAQTGIALDGSGSMAKLYGVDDGSRVLSPIFGGPKKLHNDITPVAQQLCAYLARKIDADGGTTCIYWAVGPGGGQIEVVGDLTADQAEKHIFGPPRDFGTGTQLLPAVKYFVERFKDAPWGFYIFITDGELHDLDAVIDYSKRLAREVAAGRRNPLKFVLIGIGTQVNEAQMTELDDLDAGVDVDLWDHKLAAEMRVLQEIFAEVVDKNSRVSDNGRILDPSGRVVKDYSDAGLPAYLEFEMPSADYFTLDVNGQRINQPLSDHVQTSAPPIPVAAPPAPPPIPPAPQWQAPPPPPIPAAPKWQAPPSPPIPPMPAMQAPPTPPPQSKAPAARRADEDDDDNALWKGIDLEFNKEGAKAEEEVTDVELEEQKDDEST